MIRIQCAAGAGAPQVQGTGQGDDTAQRGRDLVRVTSWANITAAGTPGMSPTTLS